MKNRRIIALVLVFVLFCSSAMAETISPKKMKGTFTVRNGITFGMTKQQVIDFEKSEGMKQVTSNWENFNNIRYGCDNNHLKFFGKYLPVYMHTDFSNNKSYSGAALYAEFENNKLCEIDYVWKGFDSSDVNAVQNEILPSLKSKYGYPTSMPREALKPLFTNYGPSVYSSENGFEQHFNSIEGNPYFWLLQYDDGYCLVTFYTIKQQNYAGGKYYNDYYQMHLIYTYISESEYNEYVSTVNKNNQAIQDEKRNGL